MKVAESISRYAELCGEDRLRLVVRNGRAQPRKVVISGMAVPVQAPAPAGRGSTGRRSAGPLERTRSPAKVRTRKTKGAGSRTARLAMAYKQAHTAQQRWRKVNAPHLVRLIREGVRFKDGKIAPSAGPQLPL